MTPILPQFTTVYLKQVNPLKSHSKRFKSKKEQGNWEKRIIAEEGEIKDKIKTAFERYKIEIIKLNMTLEREHVWWKLTLEGATDFSSLQEVQYDLDLMFDKKVLLLVNPVREITIN